MPVEKYAYENLERIIFRKNISKFELHRISGCSRTTIDKVFSQKKDFKIRLGTVVKISKALNVDFPEIFSGNPDKDFGEFDSTFSTSVYLENFVENVRKKLINRTQFSLSVTGLSESTISDLLSGKTVNPQMKTLLLICKELSIHPSKAFRKE